MKKLLFVLCLIPSIVFSQKISSKDSKAKIALALNRSGVLMKTSGTPLGNFGNMSFVHIKVEELIIKQKYTAVSISTDFKGVEPSYALVDSDELPTLIKALEMMRDTKGELELMTTYDFKSRGGFSVSLAKNKGNWEIWIEIGSKSTAITKDIDLLGMLHCFQKGSSTI